MLPAAQEDFISRILSGYTTLNHAHFLNRDSVHICIDYLRLMQDARRGMLSRKELRRLTDGLCALLSETEGMDASTIQRGQMFGEIRLHVVLYHLFGFKQCEQIDLNVFPDGKVRDRRFLVNFLSATLFRVL